MSTANDLYLSRLMKELESEGVKPVDESGEAIETMTMVNRATASATDSMLKIITGIEQATNTKFSQEQKDILKNRGSACILASAGSGKTTISINLIAKCILSGEIDPDRTIYATYSKAGATEMKTRLDALLKQLGVHRTVQVRTLHSFFLKLLREFGIKADIIKESDRMKFVKEACKESGYLCKDDELMLIDNLLSYQVNNLLSDKATIGSYINTIEELTLEQYSKIRQGYVNRKAQAGVIDYDDMQTYLYMWLVKYAKSSNPNEIQTAENVRNYCKSLYDSFFIDEAQDISKIQFAILRAMVTTPENNRKLDKTLVFIGDDDQCIYQWRGSDPSIILSIAPAFDMKTFVLSTNYRCKNEIVDYAARGVKCNSSRYAKSMQAFQTGGNVKICISPKEDLFTLSTLAYRHIKRWVAEGENLSNIAVLGRNNFHLAILGNLLLRDGIFCNLSEEMKLTKNFMFKDMERLIDLTQDSWDKECVSQILWKLCKFMSIGTARSFAEFMDSSGLCFRQALGYMIQNAAGIDVGFSDKVNVPIQAFEKIKYYARTLGHDTLSDLVTTYSAIVDNETQATRFKALASKYLDCTTRLLYKSKDKSRSIYGIVRYFNFMIDRTGFDQFRDFIRMSKQYEAGTFAAVGEQVTLTTVHSAKGREWKNVIMFACDNVSQPSVDGIAKMMDDGVQIKDIHGFIEEERRLCYVGNTRAKENLFIITNEMPSMFILEALGGITDNFNGRIIDMASDTDGYKQLYSGFVARTIRDPNSKYYFDYKTDISEEYGTKVQTNP